MTQLTTRIWFKYFSISYSYLPSCIFKLDNFNPPCWLKDQGGPSPLAFCEFAGLASWVFRLVPDVLLSERRRNLKWKIGKCSCNVSPKFFECREFWNLKGETGSSCNCRMKEVLLKARGEGQKVAVSWPCFPACSPLSAHPALPPRQCLPFIDAGAWSVGRRGPGSVGRA